MKKSIRSAFAVFAVTAALAACGQSAETPTETPPAQVTQGPPTPEDFQPCNAVTFADVAGVLGGAPTIAGDDNTGAATGWATCEYAREDGAGPTMSVNVVRAADTNAADARHQEIMGHVIGAEAVAGDTGNAMVWTENGSTVLQYTKGWWVVRYIVNAEDADARARLLAAPRFPS